MNFTQLNQLIADYEAWFKDPSKGKHLEFADVCLHRVDLRGRRLLKAQFVRVDFSQASLEKILLPRAEMVDCNFSHANLDGTRLSDTTLKSVFKIPE